MFPFKQPEMLDKAIEIATRAHSGQVDKAGKPYILHPLRVMLAGESEEEMVLGVLHDVVEDSDIPFSEIESAGFSPEICHALRLLTHDRKDSYDEYIKKVATDPLAIRVKLHDLHDNMNRDRLNTITPIDEDRLAKYQRSQTYLLSILGES